MLLIWSIPCYNCQNATSLQENVSDVPAEHLVSKGDPRCSSFHLFLSGDSHSPVGNTPSSGNVCAYCLFLPTCFYVSKQICRLCETDELFDNYCEVFLWPEVCTCWTIILRFSCQSICSAAHHGPWIVVVENWDSFCIFFIKFCVEVFC